MKLISILDKIDFKGKDMFELKDPIQNDGTDDAYKHYFVYQYC